jgi:hypothetical protein
MEIADLNGATGQILTLGLTVWLYANTVHDNCKPQHTAVKDKGHCRIKTLLDLQQ